MKQITMDFETYSQELIAHKNEGYAEAVNDMKKIWFEMEGKDKFHSFFEEYDEDVNDFLPLREMILFINNKFGFKP